MRTNRLLQNTQCSSSFNSQNVLHCWSPYQRGVYVWMPKSKDFSSPHSELMTQKMRQMQAKRSFLWQGPRRRERVWSVTDSVVDNGRDQGYIHSVLNYQKRETAFAVYEGLRSQRRVWQRYLLTRILFQKHQLQGKQQQRRRARAAGCGLTGVRANGRVLVRRRVSPKGFLVGSAVEVAMRARMQCAKRLCPQDVNGMYPLVEDVVQLKKIKKACVAAAYPGLVRRLNQLANQLRLRHRLWRREQRLQLDRFNRWVRWQRNPKNKRSFSFRPRRRLQPLHCWQRVKGKLRFLLLYALKQGVAAALVVAKAHSQGRSPKSLAAVIKQLRTVFEHRQQSVHGKYLQAHGVRERVDFRKRIAALTYKEKHRSLPQGNVGQRAKRVLAREAWANKVKGKKKVPGSRKQKYQSFKHLRPKREFRLRELQRHYFVRAQALVQKREKLCQGDAKLTKKTRALLAKIGQKGMFWLTKLRKVKERQRLKRYRGDLQRYYGRWHRIGKGYRRIIRTLRDGLVLPVKRPSQSWLFRRGKVQKQRHKQERHEKKKFARLGLTFPGFPRKKSAFSVSEPLLERNFAKLYVHIAQKTKRLQGVFYS